MKKEDHLMNLYLNYYPPKKKLIQKEEEDLSYRNRKINGLAVEATLDLHGSTISEALNELNQFITSSVRYGRDKVLIIHGKGKHSPQGKAILKEAVLEALQQNPHVRKFGRADLKDGGGGATWAVLKNY